MPYKLLSGDPITPLVTTRNATTDFDRSGKEIRFKVFSFKFQKK